MEAVRYIHSKQVIHRDLKPQNIMLSENSEHGVIKLVDFGLTCFAHMNSRLYTICGTTAWLATELVLCELGFRSGYVGGSVDMWGIGLVLLYLFIGFNPFEARTKMLTFSSIVFCRWERRLKFASSSRSVKAFLGNLIVRNPRHRMSAERLQHEPWLSR